MQRDDSIERLEQLETEMKSLQAMISGLQTELDALREEYRASSHPVETLLQQRGLPVLAQGDTSRTLLPAGHSFKARKTLFQLMRRYSFRLFLRDLIQFPENEDPEVLTRYCSIKTVRYYLKVLAELDIVTVGRDRCYGLVSKQVSSFGPTLEWYVSEIFQREFISPVLFNVRLQNTQYGGDYDVIAIVSGYLVYVEVKSSPPRGVELQAVSAFLNRLRDLQPHVAIFLVDTELRMKDKIVPLFEEAMDAGEGPAGRHSVTRLINEIFHIHHSIYLTNSRKGIYTNLRTCFRDFLHGEQRPADGVTRCR